MTSRFTESTYPYPPTITSTDSRSRSGSGSGAEDEDRRREEASKLTKQVLLSPGQGTRTTTLPPLGQEPQNDGAAGDGEVEMDKSVLQLGRPCLSTESLPPTPLLGYTDRSGTVRGTIPPTINTDIAHEEEAVASSSSLARSSPSSPRPRPQQSLSSELQASRPAPSPPMSQSTSSKTASQKGTTRKRTDSCTSPNSVFRLLPRETRPALRRMLCFDPKARTTMGRLLWGRYGGGGIIGLEGGEKCGCEMDHESGDDLDYDDNNDEDEDEESDDEYDEDLGDPWVKSIETCSGKEDPTHVHVRIPADEKASKRRFF